MSMVVVFLVQRKNCLHVSIVWGLPDYAFPIVIGLPPNCEVFRMGFYSVIVQMEF